MMVHSDFRLSRFPKQHVHKQKKKKKLVNNFAETNELRLLLIRRLVSQIAVMEALKGLSKKKQKEVTKQQ